MNEKIYDLIIIGGGPAGLTAGIYTSRAAIDTLLIEGSPHGGQLTITTDVENFPGFENGVLGPQLIENMRMQAKRFGTNLLEQNVTKVSGSFESGFEVEADDGRTYRARVLILATGATAKWLGLESETRLRGKGVSACATCDGFFFKNKNVAIVGGGDSAMEEANFLTKFANKVYVLVRGEQSAMRASKFMLARSQSNPKIEFIYNTSVKEVLGEQSVTGLQLVNAKTGEESLLPVEGLFIAIGHKPNTAFLNGFVETDEIGYIKVTNGTNTSVRGVFTAGDVSDKRYRQAISAAGYGCMAALDAEKFLAEHGNH